VLGAIGLYFSETRRSAVLANGRLAMMAIIGMFFQDGLAGSVWGDWALSAGTVAASGDFGFLTRFGDTQERRVGQWPPCNDVYHWYALPGGIGKKCLGRLGFIIRRHAGAPSWPMAALP
jgi:hypothetical protein